MAERLSEEASLVFFHVVDFERYTKEEVMEEYMLLSNEDQLAVNDALRRFLELMERQKEKHNGD